MAAKNTLIQENPCNPWVDRLSKLFLFYYCEVFGDRGEKGCDIERDDQVRWVHFQLCGLLTVPDVEVITFYAIENIKQKHV